ncbi:MAG: 5-formyltetrahydrofolate cyclo-ligase [Oscillospiraceae bacterium]|jgi:5-formyltetrahydrofolate cyclo-ligase|nr:5-formyltetrahydrofolate cyclo-ligase [Oscillospiraceae bacterium]
MKKQLREKYRNIRDGIPSEIRRSKSREIFEKIIDSDVYKNCKLLLSYYAVGSEAETRLIAGHALRHGKQLALPKCAGNGIMFFYAVNENTKYELSRYGIPEPPEYAGITDFNGALCLVPGLAFTKDGARLGYGGGYYDRFLSMHGELLTAGLCYRECIADFLPEDPYDIRCKLIISG